MKIQIEFSEPAECRAIAVADSRWGVAIYGNGGWSVYRATETGLEFVRWLKQLGPETILPMVEAEIAEEVVRRG